MTMPGFSAAESIYDPHAYYTDIFSFGDSARLATVQPTLPLGGLNRGDRCSIDCTPCDVNCHHTCTNSCSGRSIHSSCCTGGSTCYDGRCICPSPRTKCGASCTDTTSDPNNCGQCSIVCPPGGSCQQGECFPKPMSCGPCTPDGQGSGTQTCCQQVSLDQNLCGVDTCQPPPPTCQTFNGFCTGANGPEKCISAAGRTQCCHSNLFYGWFPWIRTCSDGTVTQGCNGPCW